MNKKFSIGVMISLIAIACAITYVVTITVSTNMFNQRIGGVTQREEIYSKIQEIDSYVRSASYYDINESTLINSVIGGYVDGLDDAGAEYLTASEAYKREQLESGSLISTGLEVSKEESGYIRVDRIYESSPASTMDIQVGDIITAVDGTNVLEAGADAAITSLDGDENTNVRLTVQRSGETKDLTVVRRSFTIKSVTAMEVSGYGYIRISDLNGQTDEQFTAAVQDFQTKNVQGYIIDLRGTGGIYDCLKPMLEPFVAPHLIANVRYKDDTAAKFLETEEEATVTVPIAVLVDENTSGAAELFAVSLRDHAGAKLVGKQTAGNGYVREMRHLSDGTALVITIAKLAPSVTASLDGGLKVDFSVEQTGDPDFAPTGEGSQDPQINKAFEVMESLSTVPNE